MTTKHVGRVITAIGKAAGVIVTDSGKAASAHDLRRSFGQSMPMRDSHPGTCKPSCGAPAWRPRSGFTCGSEPSSRPSGLQGFSMSNRAKHCPMLPKSHLIQLEEAKPSCGARSFAEFLATREVEQSPWRASVPIGGAGLSSCKLQRKVLSIASCRGCLGSTATQLRIPLPILLTKPRQVQDHPHSRFVQVLR